VQLTIAVLVALAAYLAPRCACAETSRVVLVLSEAERSEQAIDSHLLGALRGQLSEINVEVIVVSSAHESLANAARRAKQLAKTKHALGVIWLEQAPSQLSVYLYDSVGRLYGRDIDADGSPASQSEAIAIVLRSAVAAMLEGDEVGMTEVQLPAPSAINVAAPPSSPPPRRTIPVDQRYLRVGVSYVGTLFARRTPWQHGVELALSGSPTESPWFFGLGYTYFSAVDFESMGVKTRVERHPVEAFGGLDMSLGAVSVNVQGAVSADYIVRKTPQVGEGFLAAPTSGRWLCAVSTRLGATVAVTRHIYGVMSIGADFVLNPYHQVVQQSSADEVIGSPLLARPRLELGVALSVW